MKYHELEGPTFASDPVLSNRLGQCFFLVFEVIRSFLIANVSLCFDDMFIHKEDEAFLNICMGSNKWVTLRCSQYGNTTIKKDTGEGHACYGPLRPTTNVTYSDGP